MIVRRDQRLTRFFVRDAVADRIKGYKRVAREIHLRDQPLLKVDADDRKMDMSRAPGVEVVAPRVRAGADGRERIHAISIC